MIHLAKPADLQEIDVPTEVSAEESFFLGFVGVEHGCLNALVPAVAATVFPAYFKLLEALSEAGGKRFQAELARRRDVYGKALQEPHSLGPAWQIGKAFAQLCQADWDPRVITFGSLIYVAQLKAVDQVIDSIVISDT